MSIILVAFFVLFRWDRWQVRSDPRFQKAVIRTGATMRQRLVLADAMVLYPQF
jgi:hypothetical protein